MPELKTSIPIFISSTFIDLKDLRSTVSARLRDVFGAQLITMETFGSDDAPPDILSVRQVRQCDIFVGIYARRYGTVDQMTGKSITELELDQAERAFSAGTLTGILLYLLEDDAPWPEEFIEADSISTGKLSLLKQRARQHTVTPFRSPEDLPFMVIKGVLDKIRHRIGMQLPQARHFSLPPERKLHQPIGMEFLTSADKRHLFGRGDKITEILERLDSNPITLLLGNSGAGKTSLIHAGLLPVAVEKGWLPIYSRPLGLPRTDVLTTLFSTVPDQGSTGFGMPGMGAPSWVAGFLLILQNESILWALGIITLLFLMRVLLRKQWLAVGVSWILLALPGVDWRSPIDVVSKLLSWALVYVVLLRFGILALAISWLFVYGLELAPVTPDFSQWYAWRAVLILLPFVALVLYGFRTALGRQPIFGAAALDE